MKPRIQSQGKIVMELDGPGWLMMTPDGEVTHQPNKASAEKAAKEWFSEHCPVDPSGIGIGRIEWRYKAH